MEGTELLDMTDAQKEDNSARKDEIGHSSEGKELIKKNENLDQGHITDGNKHDNRAGTSENTNRTPRRICSNDFRYGLVKTAFMVALWVAFGSNSSILGTTFVDFDEKLQTTFDRLGIVLVFRGVLSLVGSVVGAVLRDKVGIASELILVGTCVLTSLADFLKPWSTSIAFFGAMNAVDGFCLGCMNTVANAMLVAMWGKKASAPVHMLHFGYGLGAFLGPLLAKDFLSVRCPNDLPSNVTSVFLRFRNTSNTRVDASTLHICANSTKATPVILTPSRLEIPFSVIAATYLALSFVFLIYYFHAKCSKQTSAANLAQEDEQVKGQDRQQPLKFFLPFAVGLFLLYACITSFEGALYSYLFTFAFESGVGFDKPEAAYLQSAYWGSYTCSRFAASVIAHFVSVKIMIFVEMVGTLGSLIGFLLLGFRYKAGMWAFACALGVFVAPIWPSGIAWADRYITVKAYVVSVTDIASGIFGSIFSWWAGYLVEHELSRSYLIVAVTGNAAALSVLIVMQILSQRHGDRHNKRATSDETRSTY